MALSCPWKKWHYLYSPWPPARWRGGNGGPVGSLHGHGAPRSTGCMPAWPGEETPPAANPVPGNSSLPQEFSRDVLYIPKRGRCQDDGLRGDNIWYPALSADGSRSESQRMLKSPLCSCPRSPGGDAQLREVRCEARKQEFAGEASYLIYTSRYC